MRVAKLGSIALLLFAAGCADMQGLSPQARLDDANRLAAGKTLGATRISPAAWPAEDWWKRYGDPQLDRLIEEALRGSPTLRVAAARQRRALAYVSVSKAALLPRVDGSGSVIRQRFPEHGLYPPPIAGGWDTQNQLQATLDYEIDFWDKNRAAYESALGQAKAAEVDTYAARLALSVNVAQAYVRMQRAYRQLDVMQATLRQREQIYALTRDRVAAGIDSRLDLKQAEGAIPATREQIVQQQEAIDLARNQLAALIGAGPDRGLEIPRPDARAPEAPELPSAVPADLIGRRPDVVAQRWRVEAAGRDIDVAKAQFYPNVSLTAFLGLQSIGLSQFLRAGSAIAGAGPALSLPIFDGGRLRGNLAAADADYDTAVELYNQTLVDALRDVVDQLASLRSVGEQRRQQRIAVATAQEAYDLALLRYREGIGNYLQVLTAQWQLLAQQSLEVDLDATELSLSINLTRALGGGFADGPKSVAAVAR